MQRPRWSSPSSRKRWLWLAIPFAVVGVGSRALVPSLGDAIARALSTTVREMPSVNAGAGAAIVDALPLVLPDAGAGAGADDALDAGATKSAARDASAARAGGGDADGGRLTAYVPLASVEKALDDQGQSLRGRTLWAGGKSRGVRLTGVSGMGVGLKDGDIIVAVDGQPAMDDDTATDLALAVVARGDRVLHATLLRGDRPIDVTLELPKDQDGADAKASRR
jgi:hypothetical protein